MATTGTFDKSDIALELNPDGTITHFNTREDLGQGGDIGTLTHTVKALEPMSVKASQIQLVMNDTKTCPNSGIAAASRSHYMNGNATIDAANKLLKAMCKPDGYRTYDEMIAEEIPTKYQGHFDQFDLNLPGIDPNTGEGERNSAFMYVVNLVFVENPRPHGPHGSSGCSENFQCSGHMAVINAINNATGVRVYDLPATPDKVKAGWEAKQKGANLTPEKYFLGSEFEEELAFIKANPL